MSVDADTPVSQVLDNNLREAAIPCGLWSRLNRAQTTPLPLPKSTL